MGLFSRIEKRVFGDKKEQEHRQSLDEQLQRSLNITNGTGMGLPYSNGSLFFESNSMELSAVYRAVEAISNSVAELDLNIFKVDNEGYKTPYKDHPTYSILTRTPNERLSIFQLKKMLVQSMFLRGNAYAWIERKGKTVKAIHFIPTEYVTIDDNSLNFLDKPVIYHITGVAKPVPHKDMIHLTNTSYDGVNGISTLAFAYQTLKTAFNAEQASSNFFENGNCTGAILKVHSSLTKEQKEDIRKSWNSTMGSKNGMNSLVLLEGNMDLLNGMVVDPDKAQMLESRHFSVDEIARFFGVSPLKLGDLTHNSYSTLEMAELQYLADTIAPILKKIECELERKLFGDEPDVVVRFDTTQLLRTDKASQANYLNTLFQIGVLSQNQIRKILDMDKIENGDHHYVQVNVQTLEKATSEDPATSQDIKEALND